MGRTTCNMRLDFQNQRSQIRHKKHRDPPTQQQSNDSDRKNCKGVFTCDRFGQTNGQEASGGDEGTGQHGHGGHLVGKGGSADFVKALFHFANHHLHRNDGVVHQQTQSNDERTQRYLVQTNAEVIHRQKRHGQHQGNGDAHHQTRSHIDMPPKAPTFVPTQGHKADHQHNHHSLDQHADKLADRAFDRFGLVLQLHQSHAMGQVGLNFGC